MKIISLMVENFKKIRAIEIVPTGSTVTISGKNKQGKTSILDAIMIALAGSKGMPDKPVREGAEKALIQIDCGDFTVERRISKTGTTLKVESKDGVMKSPQAFLDKIIGDISFDPLNFIRKDPKEQKKTILELTGCDTVKLDDEIKQLKEIDRPAAGRERDRVKSVAASLVFTPDLPEEEISSDSVLLKIDEADAHNKKVEDLAIKIARIDEWVSGNQERVGSHRSTKKKLEEEQKRISRIIDEEDEALKLESENMEKATTTKKTYQGLISSGPHQDTANLRAELSGLADKNKLIAANKSHLVATADYKAKAKEYDTLTRKIEDMESRKTEMLMAAKMPIEGLAFGEDCILYNRIPLSQVSDSEKIKIGIAIAMKLNPVLKVIRITDGSLLDSDTMADISKMIQDEDFQLWIEKVEDGGKVGIVIEDGSVKENEQA
jgi:DNA repair exonuclease SbcCD ATPase subunit